MNRHFFTMWLCWMDVYYFTKIFTRSFCLVRNAAQGFTRRSPPIRCLDIFSNISLFISLSAGAVAGADCTRRCHSLCTLYLQMDTLHIYNYTSLSKHIHGWHNGLYTVLLCSDWWILDILAGDEKMTRLCLLFVFVWAAAAMFRWMATQKGVHCYLICLLAQNTAVSAGLGWFAKYM